MSETTSASVSTTAATSRTVIHRAAGDGEPLWAMGSLFEVKLSDQDSGGALTVMEVTPPPGIATPLHVHHREAEVFYLLAGTLDYEAGGTLYRLAAGDFIWLPKDVPHRFRVTGDTPARFLALCVPGGIERLYRTVGVPAAARALPGAYPAEPELARWRTAAPAHGLEVLGPPLPAPPSPDNASHQ
jgi:quercetin dioxygenase-like cupin family protein